MTTLNYFCLVVLCSDKFWCFNFALMMQSYLQEINQIEWEIFFTNKVLTKFFQQKYCDIINVAISCLKEALMQSKVIEKSVKYREIFWHFFSSWNLWKLKKNFRPPANWGELLNTFQRSARIPWIFARHGRLQNMDL